MFLVKLEIRPTIYSFTFCPFLYAYLGENVMGIDTPAR
jgi:hypothetical protein